MDEKRTLKQAIKDWDNGGQAPISFGKNNRQGVRKVLIFEGSEERGKGAAGGWRIVKTWTAAQTRE